MIDMIRISTTDIIKDSANTSVEVSLSHNGRISFVIVYGGTDTIQHAPDLTRFSLTKEDARILADDIRQAARA